MIQNVTNIVDIKHKNYIKKTDNKNFGNLKINVNKNLRISCLIPNYECIYEVITKALKMKKLKQSQSKLQYYFQILNFNDLFSYKIFNTISINSPNYENLNHRQENIFNDPFHEEMLKHESSLPLNHIKIDISRLYIDYKEKEINNMGKIQNLYISNKYNKNNEGEFIFTLFIF